MDLGSFGGLLFSSHAMLAAIAGNNRLLITQEESEHLALAIGNVIRHYDIPGLSQQTIDWIALIQCVGVIYGTRFVAARMEARSNVAKDVTPKPEVKPMTPGAPNSEQPKMPDEVEIPGFGKVRPAGGFQNAA